MNLDEIRPILDDISVETYGMLVIVLSLIAIRLLVFRVVYDRPYRERRSCLMQGFWLLFEVVERRACIISPMGIFDLVFRWAIGLGLIAFVVMVIIDLQ